MKTTLFHGKCPAAIFIGMVIVSGSPSAGATDLLGRYNVKPDEITVSGISSGAYMAVQMAVSDSAIVKGVGAISGGPYYCSRNGMTTATSTCMIGTPNAGPLVGTANKWSDDGEIDPVSNLATQKIWLFNGYNDGVVKRPVTDALYNFFKTYAANENHIYYKTNLNAAHSQVTASYGQTCSKTGGGFINQCNYDAAGLILQHLYGALQPKKTSTLSRPVNRISQSEFFNGDTWSIGMSHDGFVYVPAACAAQQPCRLHIAFHGCKQYATSMRSDYAEHAGYNEWADANNIIVLYPQTVATTVTPFNPNGCWDWWGYVNADYAKKSSMQTTVVRAMASRIASGSSAPPAPAGQFGMPKNVTAADSTDTRVALFWSPVAAAKSYNLYRAPCAQCRFEKINAAPLIGASAGDFGLQPQKKYFYKVRAVDGNGRESQDSTAVNMTTAAPPPSCNPYHRDNFSHWVEGRANLIWGFAYAKGSNDPMGPGNVLVETTLHQLGPNHFKLGPCG